MGIPDLMIITSDDESEEEKTPFKIVSLENNKLIFLWDIEKQLQIPFKFASSKDNNLTSLSDSQEDEEMQVAAIQFSFHSYGRQEEKQDKKMKGVAQPYSEITALPFEVGSMYEIGSTSSLATCPLCRDVLPMAHTKAPTCCHSFCHNCIQEYVGRKLNENIHKVTCPVLGCETALGFNFIRKNVVIDVHERWALAIHEASVLGKTMRITCPLEGCVKTMVDDEREYMIRACTSCWRLFCMTCRAPWHMGMTCHEHRRQVLVEQTVRDLLELTRRMKERDETPVKNDDVKTLRLRRPVRVVGLDGRIRILYI